MTAATQIRAQRQKVARDPIKVNTSAVAGTIAGGVATGLWTWAAVAALNAGPVGWTIAGVFFGIVALCSLGSTITSLFMIFG